MDKLCRLLQINRSGYNAWKLRGISKRKREEQVLLCAIITLHHQYPAMGLDGIYHTLKKHMRCSRNRIHRLMKNYNIHSIRKNAYKSTTNSNHSYPICENLLKRDFFADIPNSKWVGDITYIRTDEGWLYLATVKDLCTKKIVGYAFMSRKGDPYDNAVAENFFSCLKNELVHHKHYKTRAEAQADIFAYIETYYNAVRPHSGIGWMSPNEFEEHLRSVYAAKVA